MFAMCGVTMCGATLIAIPGWTQDSSEPFVEITITPDQVSVGEPVTLRVSVFVPTWIAKPPMFPSFEIPNAITRLPPDSSRSTSRRIGRDMWSGVTRRYQIYPLASARFRLAGLSVRIVYADPGSDPVQADLDTGDILFSATVPDGAEGLDPYVAGSRLELSRDVEGEVGALKVGDALVVTYTAELDGLSALFLPALVQSTNLPGVSVYADQPMIEDGEPARRVERLTYIFNSGGSVEIPAARIDWWNTGTRQVETAAVSPLTVNVAGPPLDARPAGESGPAVDWRLILLALAGVCLGLWLVRKPFARWRAGCEEHRRLRQLTEAYAFEQVEASLAAGDPGSAYTAIVRWLERLQPDADTRTFAAVYGDATLQKQIADLNRSLYAGSGDHSVQLMAMSSTLPAARQRCLAERERKYEKALPALNP